MKRVYTKVIVEFSPEGLATPVRMEYADRWFDVGRLVRVETRSGCLRYEVRVYGQTRYLWREGDRWFVEVAG